MATVVGSSSSPSGGFACTIAAGWRIFSTTMDVCQHSICLTAAAGFIIGRTKLLRTVLPAESSINMPADNQMTPARDRGNGESIMDRRWLKQGLAMQALIFSRADDAGSGGYRPSFELRQVAPMQLV
ncbi:hypothetical protein V6N13_121487 [Hibiscus sabdariffa]